MIIIIVIILKPGRDMGINDMKLIHTGAQIFTKRKEGSAIHAWRCLDALLDFLIMDHFLFCYMSYYCMSQYLDSLLLLLQTQIY